MSRSRRDGTEGLRLSVRSIEPLVLRAAEAITTGCPGAVALVLGGSQARGEAVWIALPGRRVCLSDLDFHLVVRGEGDREPAARAIESRRIRLVPELEAMGLVAPLEVGVHPEAEWRALPARPATLELRRAGRVIEGDEAVLSRLPDWAPGDVPAEEIRLLLENRAFELLSARRFDGGREDEIEFLRAAHAQYKVALDLAGVAILRAGRFEPGAADRVRVARESLTPGAGEPAWDRALAWIRGERPAAEAREADWWTIARAWVAAWNQAVAPGADAADFEAVAMAAARRARLRRRMRMALRPEMRRGLAPPLTGRLGHAFTGTPQHRLNASAGAFLSAQVRRHERPDERAIIDAKLERVLNRLGAVAPGPDPQVAAGLRATWHRWVLAEARGADPS